jgi:hypothetical protein
MGPLGCEELPGPGNYNGNTSLIGKKVVTRKIKGKSVRMNTASPNSAFVSKTGRSLDQ